MLLTAAGVALIVVALADLVNTLVSTSTSYHPLWPSRWIGRSLFVTVRAVDDLLCPRGFWSIDSTVRAWSATHEIERVSD